MKASRILIGVALLALLSSCVDNYVSIEVLGAKPFAISFVTIENDENGDAEIMAQCALPGLGGAEQRTSGWIDFDEDYYSFIQPFEFRNNLQSSAVDDGRLDTNSFNLEKMVVSYVGLPGHEDVTASLTVLADTEIYINGVVESGGGGLMIPLNLIPDFRGRAIQQSLVSTPGSTEKIMARFHIEGRTNSGMKVSSGTIDFPITVGYRAGFCDDGRCDCYRWQE